MSRRLIRWMAVSDNHGDAQDNAAVAAALEFCKHFKPTIRLHLGDGVDLRPFRDGASDEEKQEGIRNDIDYGLDFIRKYKPTVYLNGNHDDRLEKRINGKDKAIGEYAAAVKQELGAALDGAKVYPYDKDAGVHYLGDTACVHGYSAGVYAARAHAMTYGNMLMGHIHCTDVASVERKPKAVGRAIGCLCKLRMEYNKKYLKTLRHSLGFAYGFVLDGKKTPLTFQAEPIGDEWYYPSEFRRCNRRGS